MRTCIVILSFLLLFTVSAVADPPQPAQNGSIGVPTFAVVKTPQTTAAACSEVSLSGQNGSIDVPSAFIRQGVARAAIYNTYASQRDMLGAGNKLENDTVYGAVSYAPLRYLEVSIESSDSSSSVNSSQNLHYSGDLRIGIKGSHAILPYLSAGILAEALLYSKVGSTGLGGYSGSAAGYALSLLVSYDMRKSGISFPMIANLRAGYLWDNTQTLLSGSDDSTIPPLGKYAMGIRGDNRTLLGISFLFPLPQYYIEPAIEFTSEIAGSYGSYALTDPSYKSVTFTENPVYLTPGIIFFTPVSGLRVAVAAGLSLSRRIAEQSGGYAYVTPKAVWIAGISYSLPD